MDLSDGRGDCTIGRVLLVFQQIFQNAPANVFTFQYCVNEDVTLSFLADSPTYCLNTLGHDFLLQEGQVTFNSAVITVGGGKVATPDLLPAAGTYPSPITVTMSCGTTGATIRYTQDGSEPTETSPTYSAPFQISGSPGETRTVKAKAFKSGMTPSDTATVMLTLSPTPIPGDTTEDGLVDGLDAFYFLLWWRQPATEAPDTCNPVEDEVIDESDLLRLIADWSETDLQ